MLEKLKNEKLDIIILIGQSNAVGCGGGVSEYMYEKADDVYMITRDKQIHIADEELPGFGSRGSIGLRFATLYKQHGLLKEGRRLMIVRGCRPWTGFMDNHWTPDGDLYLRTIDMTKAVLDLNPENRLITILWHQGELDICGKSTTYYRDLSTLINGLRSTFQVPRLPFICGDICHDWLSVDDTQNREIWSRFTADMVAACIDTGFSRCVMTYDLKSNRQDGNDPSDNIHFCRDSLRILGDRYFAAYCDLIGVGQC